MDRFQFFFIVAFSVSLCVPLNVQAATEIHLWHAMAGPNGEKLTQICNQFNSSQKQYKIVPVLKGNYTQTLTAGIAAFRSGQPPHIIQASAVATMTVMAAMEKGAFIPVYKLMEDAGEPFDPKAYLPALISFFFTPDRKLASLPFNCSTPILYYNKDAFKKAGLNPNQPPKTWPELLEMAQKCVKVGYFGFTTAWPSWVMIENLGAWHNLPFATKMNGFAGMDTELVFNDDLRVRQIQKMFEWQKDKIFKYGGRMGDATKLFNAGQCAIFFHSSAGLSEVRKGAQFEFATGMLPYWPDISGAPQNSIIGGASLWVMKGLPAQDYKGVAKFFTHLSRPEVQADWHQFSGYLPSTIAAYQMTKKAGHYEKNPGEETAIHQLTLKTPTDNSLGIRLGGFLTLRNLIETELEAAWAGKKTAKTALDTAVAEGNKVLRKFEKDNP